MHLRSADSMATTLAELRLSPNAPGPRLYGWLHHSVAHFDGGPCARPRRETTTQTIGELLVAGKVLCWRCEADMPATHRNWYDACVALADLVDRGAGRNRRGVVVPRTSVEACAASWEIVEALQGRSIDLLLQGDEDGAERSKSAILAATAPLLAAHTARLDSFRRNRELSQHLELVAGANVSPASFPGDSLAADASRTWRRLLVAGQSFDVPRQRALQTFARHLRGRGLEATASQLVDDLERRAASTVEDWAVFGERAVLDSSGKTRPAVGEDSASASLAGLAMMACASRLDFSAGTVFVVSALQMAFLTGELGAALVDLGELTTDEAAQIRGGSAPEAVSVAAALGDTEHRGNELLDVARDLLS